MAMSVEPSQDAVDMLVMVTGTDERHARRWLKATQNNVERATNCILDGEDITKYEQGTSWDDTVWDADRDGNQNLHPLGSSTNPTRGPSPAPSLSNSNPKTKSDEERDFEAALAASRQDAGMSYQQETGIIGQDSTENRNFGPATRAEYDSSQWAMIPVSSTSNQQEVVPDVPLADRRHREDTPRFLKYLPDGDYTPNLLTICHAIPQARTCLLMDGYKKEDYGFDQEWWRGHAIAMPKIVTTADEAPAQPDVDRSEEIIMEMQRLMAFLGASNRAYGSIEALNQTEFIKNGESISRFGSLLELLLTSWRSAALECIKDGALYGEDTADMQAALEKLFTTIVDTDDPQGMATNQMGLIELKLDTNPDQDGLTNVFELLGDLLWNTKVNYNNFVETPADVMVMKIHQTRVNCKLGVDAPQELYIDKFLKGNIAATQGLRQQMAQGKARIGKIEQAEQKLSSWPHPTNGTRMDAFKMLKHTTGHFSGQNRKDVDDADQSNSAKLGHEMSEEDKAIAAELDNVTKSIKEKLERLKVEKEKIQKMVADLSVSNPSGLDEADLKHRYTLRGVATKPNVTYLLRPKVKEAWLINEEQDTEMIQPKHAEEQQYEWWRIEYSVKGSTASISNAVFVPEESVLHAVQVEHNSALLVYASDDACEPVDEDGLSEALQKFIKTDNDAFQAELNRPPAYNDIAQPSIERRDSFDSMAPQKSDDGNGDRNWQTHGNSHAGFGLGYEVGKSTNVIEVERAPTPVDEIHLDPVEEGGMEMEMVEKAHEPLVPRPNGN